MLWTLAQIENGVPDFSHINFDDFLKKADAVNKEEMAEVKNELGNKLDMEPIHTHDITQITELQKILNGKLDSSRRYGYETLLSNPEDINYLKMLNTDKLTVDGNYLIDTENGNLVIKTNSTDVIARYNGESWALRIKNKDGNWELIDINEFIRNVNESLMNHQDALNKLIS